MSDNSSMQRGGVVYRYGYLRKKATRAVLHKSAIICGATLTLHVGY